MYDFTSIEAFEAVFSASAEDSAKAAFSRCGLDDELFVRFFWEEISNTLNKAERALDEVTLSIPRDKFIESANKIIEQVAEKYGCNTDDDDLDIETGSFDASAGGVDIHACPF